MRYCTLAASLLATVITTSSPHAAEIESEASHARCGPSTSSCPESAVAASAESASVAPASPASPTASTCPRGARVHLVMYWGEGCPHCEEARPSVVALAASEPCLTLEFVEVRRDEAGRARFVADASRLGVTAAGIPMFVVGERAMVGFRARTTEAELRDAVAAELASATPPETTRPLSLPVFGQLDPGSVSLVSLALAVGLVDGFNPCAFYVLVVLLSLLSRVRSRARLLLFGGTFVVVSGVVYFLFMAAWMNAFLFVGLSRAITIGLGLVLIAMGLINLKELVWFKQGISLMIPEKAKPGLFARMRAIADAVSLPAALVGITALAFFVNLIELGCTLGLPAVFTRVLSLRRDLSAGARYGYLAIYNVAYVVPLGAIVAVFAATMRKIAVTERRAKVLKALSGALLVAFGLVFLARPELLAR